MRGSENDRLPLVALTETKAIWDILLRMLYHHSIPDFSSPYEIRPLLEAARKYELECITDRLSHILSCSTHTASWEHQEIYAIASLYSLTDVALHAARKTLDTPLHTLYTKELYDVPAYIFQRLLDYRWRCAEAASRVAGFVRETTPGARPLGKLLKRIEWLPRTNFTFFRCDCGSNTVSCSVKIGSDYEVFSARGYWKEYMERAEQAVRECPVGKVVKDPGIIIPALRAADNCMNCRQHIYLDMMIFTEYLEAAVDGAVSSVCSILISYATLSLTARTQVSLKV